MRIRTTVRAGHGPSIPPPRGTRLPPGALRGRPQRANDPGRPILRVIRLSDGEIIAEVGEFETFGWAVPLAIVGGGNSAIDSARVALRLGADGKKARSSELDGSPF